MFELVRCWPGWSEKDDAVGESWTTKGTTWSIWVYYCCNVEWNVVVIRRRPGVKPTKY